MFVLKMRTRHLVNTEQSFFLTRVHFHNERSISDRLVKALLKTHRWVVGLLGGSRSEGRSNCTVGVDGLVYGVRTCTGKAGVWGLGDELCEGLVSASFVEWDRQEWVSSRY
jgi:hypothetical protein